MCTRIINGNLEYKLGLKQLSSLEDGERLIFEFKGGMDERSRPCLKTVHKLYQIGTKFHMETLRGIYKYEPKNNRLADVGEYPLLGTHTKEAIHPQEIDKIVVTGFKY